jgi:hypothetical protein
MGEQRKPHIGVVLGLGLSLGGIFLGAIAQPSASQERPAISNEADQRFIHSLVKTTLVAVNQGNLTGNYTVLQGLGNDAFHENYTSADLALIFNDLRQANIDFGIIVEYLPVFTQIPTITPDNVIRTQGYFPTSPIIEFDILFRLVGSRYRIDSIAVGIQPQG